VRAELAASAVVVPGSGFGNLAGSDRAPAARFVVTVGALGRPTAGKEDFKGSGFATVESRPMRWLFMDVHESLPEGATAKDVAQAHAADVRTQDQYGVNYLKYWVDEQGGKVSAWSRRRTPRPRCACTARPMGWSPTVSTRPYLPGGGRLLAGGS
jgi:hypothetical protein